MQQNDKKGLEVYTEEYLVSVYVFKSCYINFTSGLEKGA